MNNFVCLNKEFNLETELRDLKKIIDTTVKCSIDIGADLSESGDYEGSQEFMKVLKDLARLDRIIIKESAIAHDFTMRTVRTNEEAAGERILESLKALNGRGLVGLGGIKWKDVAEVKEYNELTWETGPGFGNKQSYPILKEDVEDDQIVMQSRDSLMCPISQGLLKDPVRNTTCNHSYSKAMIESLFHASQQAISCPVSGCRNTVMKRNLVSDEKLEKKLKRTEIRIFK